jgi:hypothetical protein
VVALWIPHTYVFKQFRITPRLAALSPVHECGKTTLLDLLELMVAYPFRSEDPSPSTIYHERDDNPHATFLIDEVDNLNLFRDERMRRLFNAGHKWGGSVDRTIGGRRRKFQLYGPMAIAAIGALPAPLMSRSIIINMQRQPPDARTDRIDFNDPAFVATLEQNRKFATTCQLNPNPEMPPQLTNRAADNWRPLIAIADALGRGDEAREAAIALSGSRSEDILVALLIDIRTIFERRGIDWIWGDELVDALIELNEATWSEFRGAKDDGTPHKLRQGEVAAMLRSFKIRSRSIWPSHRGPGDSSRKGYRREQFEQAWAAYCPPAGTPAHRSKVKYLHRP